MNKTELIDAIAKRTEGMSKARINAVLDAAFSAIQDQLAEGGAVQLLGFGSFTTGTRAARSGRHPQTGEPLKIPAATVVKFTPGKAFRERVNPRKRGKTKKK